MSTSPWKARYASTREQVVQRTEALEQRPLLGFPLASYRRFKEIEGKQLAFVIAGNLFVSVLPLFIIGYAIIEAFNPHRSIAIVLIKQFDLKGETAVLVRQTFANARSGRNTALSLSVISLFVTGYGVATAVQTAYARAFRVLPLRGAMKVVRGFAWLLLMLTVTALVLALRYWTHGRAWWFIPLLLPLIIGLEFVFYLVSPRLLLDVPFQWRHLVPGAGICVVVYAIVNIVSAFFLRNWLGAYGQAYGGFGVSLAFLAWIGIMASFWVWIGTIAAIYWERFAGADEVAEVETAVGATTEPDGQVRPL